MRATARAIAGLAGAALLGLAAAAGAAPGVGPVTNLPLPRFVSLNASEINVRRGPGLDYRRDWVYRRAGLPVRVLDEYENWRLVEDSEGEGGWVYHALISGRRMAEVVAEGVLLRADPDAAPATGACAALVAEAGDAVACAERGVLARLLACRAARCRIMAEGHAGWVPKSAIWGAGTAEVFGE